MIHRRGRKRIGAHPEDELVAAKVFEWIEDVGEKRELNPGFNVITQIVFGMITGIGTIADVYREHSTSRKTYLFSAVVQTKVFSPADFRSGKKLQ